MKNVLYLGDTHLQDAAAYLAGLMHHWGWTFDYLPSHARPLPDELAGDYGLFILSDFPESHLSEDAQQTVLDQVAAGAGLLMVGGWESFHGLGGDWDGTLLGNVLPVEIAGQDDRRNCDVPVLVRRLREHPILHGLPWEDRPPVIGGLNQVRPKPDAQVILEACLFDAKYRDENLFTFQITERLPLLVLGQYQQARTAAFLTDVAPHWVGPLVDWGTPRITAEAPQSRAVEVGGHYAQFLRQLLEWTAGESHSPRKE